MLLERSVPKQMVKYIRENDLEIAFTLCAGDTVASADDEGMWRSWYRDISVTSDLASVAPLQIAVGNHERHADCAGNRFADEYLYEPKPQFYYSFNYSSTHIQVLDPWNSTGCEWGEIDATQLAWAQLDLAKASAMRYKIIAVHPPLVYNNTVIEGMEAIVELCDDYDVDLVYYGHSHRFDHSEINGTHYLLNGVGGNNARAANPSGYCQIDVTASEMTVNMHWLNGSINQVAIILS